MRLIVICMVLLFAGIVPIDAQTQRAYIKAGDRALGEGAYYNAMHYYEQALAFKKSKKSLYYKYAEAARLFAAYDLSLYYYQRVSNSENYQKRFPLTLYWLGESSVGLGEYKRAIAYFESFIGQTSNDKYKALAKKRLQNCLEAMEIVADSNAVVIHHLEKTVNSPYSEFGATVFNDDLYYSSYRYPMSKSSKQKGDKLKISKILKQTDKRKGKPLRYGFNERDKITAHTSFSEDGQQVYYTICDYDKDNKIRCDIYTRKRTKSGRWKKAKKLPASINAEACTNTQPHVGRHPKTGNSALFFVSDRIGGKGGLDVYLVEIQGDKYGVVEHLGLNTKEDDITPFYQKNSNTLFFSSKGYGGLGGFDIFKTQWSQDSQDWTFPKNIGYPENSSYDDTYFSINKDSTQLYLSSNRVGSYALDKKSQACCSDIYRLDILPEREKYDAVELLVNKDFSLKKEDILKLSVSKITLFDTVYRKVELPTLPVTVAKLEKDDFVRNNTEILDEMRVLPLFFDNDYPNPNSWTDTTSISYAALYDNYVEQRGAYENKALSSNQTDLMSHFFTRKVEDGYRQLKLFCDALLSVLDQGKSYELTLQGSASPRSTSDYNLELSKRRVASVYNFLNDYENGVFRKYLSKGQLSLKKIYKGEVRNDFYHADNLVDEISSIYSVKACEARKVSLSLRAIQ